MKNNSESTIIKNNEHYPSNVYIDVDVIIEEGVTIMPFVVIGKGVHLKKGVVVQSFSFIEDSTIGEFTVIGPHARLRGGNKIGSHCRIGNFVEIKNSVLGDNVKAAHLAYIGDAEIGSGCNIGCGVVFCNYDGKQKHKTQIGINTFIGSNCNLIAPISIGENCFIAAGVTLDRSLQSNTFCKAERKYILRTNRFCK